MAECKWLLCPRNRPPNADFCKDHRNETISRLLSGRSIFLKSRYTQKRVPTRGD